MKAALPIDATALALCQPASAAAAIPPSVAVITFKDSSVILNTLIKIS
jgi:hypothetical protein